MHSKGFIRHWKQEQLYIFRRFLVFQFFFNCTIIGDRDFPLFSTQNPVFFFFPSTSISLEELSVPHPFIMESYFSSFLKFDWHGIHSLGLSFQSKVYQSFPTRSDFPIKKVIVPTSKKNMVFLSSFIIFFYF